MGDRFAVTLVQHGVQKNRKGEHISMTWVYTEMWMFILFCEVRTRTS